MWRSYSDRKRHFQHAVVSGMSVIARVVSEASARLVAGTYRAIVEKSCRGEQVALTLMNIQERGVMHGFSRIILRAM
jgi:hypothetical protein